MMKHIKKFIISDQELTGDHQKLLSMIFLFLSGAMSFSSYVHVGLIWNTKLSFTPSFISAVLGILTVCPLYLREILKWNRSVYSIISFALISLVFSSFIELSLGGNDKSALVYALLAIAIVISWVGIKCVAGISWALLLLVGSYSIIVNNLAFGFSGFVYVLFGFLGLVLHTGLNPGELLNGLKSEYSAEIIDVKTSVKDEISAVGDVVNSISPIDLK